MNLHSIKFGLLLGALGLFSHAHAELVATPLTGDSRLVQFGYDEDNTFLVLTRPKAVTHIQFAADEQLQSVAAGDTSQWEFTPTKNKKNLFIKPKYEDLETSLSVITDKRTYQFVLRSTGAGKKWYQRVSWLYAGTMLLESDAQLEDAASTGAKGGASSRARANSSDLDVGGEDFGSSAPRDTTQRGCSSDAVKRQSFNPSSLRFTYTVSGSSPFKPEMVFDNGKFTYFKMPADMQEMPALFAEVEGQAYSLVNYHIECDYMVAQRLIDTAVLRLGKAEVRIVRAKPSTGFFGSSFGMGSGG